MFWRSYTFSHLILLLCSDSDELDPDLARLASLGFTGCLSVVRFNAISPLKAALLHPDTSPVTITGPLVQSNCGSAAPVNQQAAENTHHLSGERGGEHFYTKAPFLPVWVTKNYRAQLFWEMKESWRPPVTLCVLVLLTITKMSVFYRRRSRSRCSCQLQ